MTDQHGESGTRLYRTWASMRRRCRYKTNGGWAKYGGRGILVCDEWADSFFAFRDWAISSGYKDHLEIDRINPGGNYEPSNCRWVTKAQQASNKGKSRAGITSKYKGVSWHKVVRKWHSQISICSKKKHLGYFKTEVDAARSYDAAAIAAYGEYAHVNFPEDFK